MIGYLAAKKKVPKGAPGAKPELNKQDSVELADAAKKEKEALEAVCHC